MKDQTLIDYLELILADLKRKTPNDINVDRLQLVINKLKER